MLCNHSFLLFYNKLIQDISFFLGNDEQHDNVAVLNEDAVQVLVKELNGKVCETTVYNVDKGKLGHLDRNQSTELRPCRVKGIEQGVGNTVVVV